MLKKLLISFVLTFATCIAVRGQYDPEYTHFWMMETSFNPAAAGNEDALNITGAYSMQMTGFRNAPKTMFASADMPFIVLKKRNGVGLLFQNDALGLFSHKKFSAQYAFHIEKFFGGRLSIGAQADLLAEEFDGTKADVETSNDPAIPTTKVTGSKVDMSVGLFYRRKSCGSLNGSHTFAYGNAGRNQRAENRPRLLFDRRIQYKTKKSVNYNTSRSALHVRRKRLPSQHKRTCGAARR